jgi:hypothetical protein
MQGEFHSGIRIRADRRPELLSDRALNRHTVFTVAGGRILIGEVMGIASTIYLWHTAARRYSFYPLIMYPPAVWLGATRLAPPERAAAALPDAAQSCCSPDK